MWLNGERFIDINNVVTAHNDPLPPYFKIGYYGLCGNTNTTYIDEIRVGDANSSYSEVAPRGGTTPAPTCANCCSSTQTCSTAFTTVNGCTRCCATACQAAPVGTACHKLAVSSAIPAPFGSPYDLAGNSQDLLISTACQSTSVRVNIGTGSANQQIWRQGYLWRNNAWQAVNLSGTASLYGSNWFQGSASATITLPSAELSQENIFIAYVCTWSTADSRWKCGCRDANCTNRYWQMQKFGNF